MNYDIDQMGANLTDYTSDVSHVNNVNNLNINANPIREISDLRFEKGFHYEKPTVIKKYLKVMIDGEEINFHLKKNPRSKKINLKYLVQSDVFLISYPSSKTTQELEEFVIKNASWIESRKAKVHQPVPFDDGQKVPFLGKQVVLKSSGKLEKSAKISFDRNVIEIYGDVSQDSGIVFIPGRSNSLARNTRKFYVEQMRKKAIQVSTELAKKYNIKWKEVKVRDTIGHWSSHSENGFLSFSWRLIMAPEWVVDYIVLKTLFMQTYLDENQLVKELAKLDVNTHKAEEWLLKKAPGLKRYGASRSNNLCNSILAEA